MCTQFLSTSERMVMLCLVTAAVHRQHAERSSSDQSPTAQETPSWCTCTGCRTACAVLRPSLHTSTSNLRRCPMVACSAEHACAHNPPP